MPAKSVQLSTSTCPPDLSGEAQSDRRVPVIEMNDVEPRLVWISGSGVNQLARGREMTRSEAMESITNHGWAPHQFVESQSDENLLGRGAALLSYIPLASTNGKA